MIKNERQYKITKTQADHFRQAIATLPRPSTIENSQILERAQREGLLSQLSDLEMEIADYEYLRSGESRVFTVSHFEEIPATLIRARIASGLTQQELAVKLKLHEQQIQQYEASDYASASFTRLKEVADVLGVVISSNVILPEITSGKDLFTKLRNVGFDRAFILNRLVPATYSFGFEETSDLKAIAGTASFAARALGVRISELLTAEPLRLNLSAVNSARHKLDKRSSIQKVSLCTVYAHQIALLALQASERLPVSPIPDDTDEIHDAIVARYGALSFSAALRYTWEVLGIPVVPLSLKGAFHGATWRVEGRNVIVLSPGHSFPAFWLNDLFHEVGHTAQEPELAEHSVVESGPIWESSDDSPEEKDARAFALDTVFRSQTSNLIQACDVEARSVEGLKRSIPLVAQRFHAPSDSLALLMAASIKATNWWGTAMTLQDSSIDPFEIAKAEFSQHANLSSLAKQDRELLSQAMQVTE